jgi:hypothetical protein
MDADSNHVREQTMRRLNVRDSVLFGPLPEPGDVATLGYGDRKILVPDNLPVRAGSLVEQNAAYGNGVWTHSCLRNDPDSRMVCKRLNCRDISKHMTHAAASPLSVAR